MEEKKQSKKQLTLSDFTVGNRIGRGQFGTIQRSFFCNLKYSILIMSYHHM